LARRIQDTTFVEGVRSIPNYSYQVRGFTGKGYICVGDAHRFLDPIFAFGVHLAMVEGRRAADTIASAFSNGGPAVPGVFADHERICEIGQDIVQSLVDGFWWNPFAFAIFVHRRYTDDFTDLFAGRVYQEEPSPGVLALRKLNDVAAGRTYY
jgi:flavin-dependent dehydrogenase